MGTAIRIILTIIIVSLFTFYALVFVHGAPYNVTMPMSAWFYWMGYVSAMVLMLMRVWRRA